MSSWRSPLGPAPCQTTARPPSAARQCRWRCCGCWNCKCRVAADGQQRRIRWPARRGTDRSTSGTTPHPACGRKGINKRIKYRKRIQNKTLVLCVSRAVSRTRHVQKKRGNLPGFCDFLKLNIRWKDDDSFMLLLLLLLTTWPYPQVDDWKFTVRRADDRVEILDTRG